MAMSWIAGLNAQDQSLEAMLARQQMQRQGMLSIAGALEDRRQQAEAERMRQQQLDEAHSDRAEAIAERKQQAENELQRRREAQVALDHQREAEARKADNEAKRDFQKEQEQKRQHDIDMAKLKSDLSLNQAILLATQRNNLDEQKGHRDNPKLPGGVQAYIQTLPGKVKTGKDAHGNDIAMKDASGNNLPFQLEDARRDISQNWGKLAAAHPTLDLKTVDQALKELFTQPKADVQASMSIQPKEGDVKPIPGTDGQTAIFQGGRWIAQ